MRFFDCHTHAEHSLDGKQTTKEILAAASRMPSLAGVTVTEHVNSRRWEKENTENRLLSYRDAVAAWRKAETPLPLFFGVEMGDVYAEEEKCERILRLIDYDVVLGSVHQPRGFDVSFRNLPFAEMSDGEVRQKVALYFACAKSMMETQDYDVWAHLTLPLRYLHRFGGRSDSWQDYQDEILPLLEVLLRRDKALEINTNGWTDEKGLHTLPEISLLEAYYAMGGRKITLGSDAHRTERLGEHFETVATALQQIGFSGAYYYHRRNEIFYPFEQEKRVSE